MRGLPKFLLPAGPDYLTLIERHLAAMLDSCNTVWIPTRPEQTILLESLGLATDRVVVVPMITQSMTETILRIGRISGASRFLMAMPDTFLAGEQPYSYLSNSSESMNLACWPIRPEQMGKLGQVLIDRSNNELLDVQDKSPTCVYEHFWGAMAFDRSVLDLADEHMPTLGDVLPKMLDVGLPVKTKVMDGDYFDCGTPSEYIQMLLQGLE